MTQPKDAGGGGQRQKKHWLDRFAGAVSVCALIASLAAAGFTGWQAWIASGQLAIAQDTEKRQLRAYLGPVADTFKVEGNAVDYKVRDFGLTPAIRPVGCAELLSVEDGESPALVRDHLFDDCDKKVRAGTAKIDPNMWPGTDYSIIVSIKDPDAGDIFSGRKAGYLFDRSTYYDVFGDVHHTYVCRRFLPIVSGHFDVRGCDNVVEPNDD